MSFLYNFHVLLKYFYFPQPYKNIKIIHGLQTIKSRWSEGFRHWAGSLLTLCRCHTKSFRKILTDLWGRYFCPNFTDKSVESFRGWSKQVTQVWVLTPFGSRTHTLKVLCTIFPPDPACSEEAVQTLLAVPITSAFSNCLVPPACCRGSCVLWSFGNGCCCYSFLCSFPYC